jgi:hypothetical protein
MAITTAMVILALAPWAVRQQIRLFLFVDTSSKEPRKVHSFLLALPYCLWQSKCHHKNGNNNSNGYTCLGSLGSETAVKIVLFVDKLSKEPRQVYPLSLALPFLPMAIKVSSQKWKQQQQWLCLPWLLGQ